jgi:hypothetical protein
MPNDQDGNVKAQYIEFAGLDVGVLGDFKWYSSPGLTGHRIKSVKEQDGVYLLISPLKTIPDPTHNQQAV